MYLNNIIIRNHYNRITDRFQIGFKINFLLYIKGFIQKNDKFRTITESDLPLFLLCCFCLWLRLSILRDRQIQLLPKECIIGTLQHLHQSLSAGIHYTSLFQNRKHLGSLFKNLICIFDNFINKYGKIITSVFCKLSCLISTAFGNSQDRSFLWLHNCFVSSFHRLIKSF